MASPVIQKNENYKEEENRVWLTKEGTVEVEIRRAETEEEINSLSVISSPRFRKKVGIRFKEIEKLAGKTALYGGNLVTRTIASFVIDAIGIKNINIFKSRKQALDWLKENEK